MGSTLTLTAVPAPTSTRARCAATSHAAAHAAAQHQPALAAAAVVVAPKAVKATGGYVVLERISGVVSVLGFQPWSMGAARLDGDLSTWSPPA